MSLLNYFLTHYELVSVYTITNKLPCEGVSTKYGELSDSQGKFIRFHLPPQPSAGRKRTDDRKPSTEFYLFWLRDVDALMCLEFADHM